MPFVLSTSSNPGTASWQDADSLAVAGSLKSVQYRIQLAELPANTVYVKQVASLPANAIVQGYSIYATEGPAGGGVSTLDAQWSVNDVSAPYPGLFVYYTGLELYNPAAPNPYWVYHTELSFPPTYKTGDNLQGIHLAADVNLDTLTNFDVTFYLYYSVLPSITVP